MQIKTAHLLTALAAIWITSCSLQSGLWRVGIQDIEGNKVGTLEIAVPEISSTAREKFRGRIMSTTGLENYPIGIEAEFSVSDNRFHVDLNPGVHDNNTYLEGIVSGDFAEGNVILATGPMGRIAGTFTATFEEG